MSDSERTADAADDGAVEPPTAELHEVLGRLDNVLDSLKRLRQGADEQDVTSDGHARMSWSSVTEVELDPTPPPPSVSEQSFRFDLGSALARLGGEDTPSLPVVEPVIEPVIEPVVEPVIEPVVDPSADLPTRAPRVEPSTDLPTRRPSVEPSPGTPPPAALPRRGTPPSSPSQAPEAAGTPPSVSGDAATAPVTPSAPLAPEPPGRVTNGPSQRSVFEDATPAPALPATPQRMPTVEPSPPVIPPGALPNLPTLPPIAPAAAPVTAEPLAVGPTTPDINAVRTYQLRAQRDQRRNKVVGRTMLVVLLLAAAVAAALFFGRSYLYPTEWDPALTPIVDQIQEAHGEEFTDEIPLETLANADHAAIVLELTVGDVWADRLPEWRALGVASGAADSSAIVDAVVAWRPAIYDPATDTLYRAAEADPAAVDAALGEALEEVFARQHGTPPNDNFTDTNAGVLGVSSLERINSRAIDRVLLVGQGDASIAGNVATTAPLPLLYEFAATDELGAPLVDAAGTAADEWSYGDTYPESTLTATDVSRVRATPGPVPPDAESLAEPVALGADNWSLIWTGRLPRSTVDRLASIVTADAYRPILRSGARCFVADLETTSDANANELLGAMARWLAAGPSGANGSATLVSPTVVEVVACDPGAEAAIAVDPVAVTDLIDRQQARLS